MQSGALNVMETASSHSKFGAWVWLWLTAAVILLDQLSKWLVASHLTAYSSVRVLPVFNLVLYYNAGAAWSFLAGASGWQRWFFIFLALAVSAAIIVWLRRLPRRQFRWRAAALALVLAGALGNVIDRLWHGYVIDFLQFHYQAWYYPAFNVADSAITIGACMLIIEGLFFRRDIVKP